MKNNIKQWIGLLDAPAKKGMPLIILAFLLSSLLDVLGVGLVGLFLHVLTNPHVSFEKFPLIQTLLSNTSHKKLIVFSGVVVVVVFIAKALFTLAIQKKVVFFCQSFLLRLQTRLLFAYQNAPYVFHLQKNTAHLLTRVQTNVSGYVNGFMMPVLNVVSCAIISSFILLFLLMVHPYSTLSLVGIFFLIGIIYDAVAKKRLIEMGKYTAVAGGEIIKAIHHSLKGLIEIRVLGKETYFVNSIIKIAREYSEKAGETLVLHQIPRYLVESIIATFVVGLTLGGLLLNMTTENIVPMVGMFAAAGSRLLPTVNQLISTISQIRSSQHHMFLVYEEFKELGILGNETLPIAGNVETKQNFINFGLRDVYYRYPNSPADVLESISLIISKGQSVGFIGSSGAGKSTLVNIILGFLEPDRGCLVVDGEQVPVMRSWLNNFAYIPQTIFLIDDTLKRNIALGVSDEEIDETRLEKAIHMAQLSEVVKNLSSGVDTFVGEGGIRLSGGQRQRVALARAFYHERDIIVMDEATSALDNETEAEVINTIKHLKGKKTLLVIAHRLSTVAHCDMLFRVERGRIVSVGSFKEVVGVTV